MSFKRTCPICGDQFWHSEHRNFNRKNLCCDKQSCKVAQKSKRQKERRYEARMARLARKAARSGARKKPVRGTIKHIAPQFSLKLKPTRGRKRKVAA